MAMKYIELYKDIVFGAMLICSEYQKNAKG